MTHRYGDMFNLLQEREEESSRERMNRVRAALDVSFEEARKLIFEHDKEVAKTIRVGKKLKLQQDLKADMYMDHRIKRYLERIVELL